MKTPPGLQPLIDDGVIDEVLRSLKSGKEATVYTLRTGTQVRRELVAMPTMTLARASDNRQS